MEDFFTRMEKLLVQSNVGRQKAETGAGQQRAALGVGQALTAGGAPGLGAIASGAAAGPVGAIVAAAQVMKQKIQEMTKLVTDGAKAILSMDPEAVAQGFANLAKQIPVIGGVLGGFLDTMMGFGQAIERTAQRLAGFSPEIATTLASIQVQRIQRDINRAQTMGPDIAQGVRTKFELEQKINDFIDRITPKLLKLFDSLMPVVEAMFDIMISIFDWLTMDLPNFFIDIHNVIVRLLDRLIPGDQLGALLERIERSTSNFGQTDGLLQLDTLRAAAASIPQNVPGAAPAANVNIPGFGVP